MYREKPPFLVAAAQLAPVFKNAPVYFDSDATLDKALLAIEAAGRRGARLIVFPELFLPGYPYWSIDFERGEEFSRIWREYLYHSPTVPGPEMARLQLAARQSGVFVAIGINERDAHDEGRMYNTIVYIGSTGDLVGYHRKLVITVQEQYYHNRADVTINVPGDNIRVYDTSIGRIGGLICGEHYQHLLQQNLINEGEQIHVALWPGHVDNPGGYSLKTVSQVTTRSHSISGQCWSVLAAAYIPESQRPTAFYSNVEFGGTYGGSCIINPAGEFVVGPVYDREDIVFAEVDLGQIPLVKSVANMKGIYDRHDVIGLVRQELPRSRSRAMERRSSMPQIPSDNLPDACAIAIPIEPRSVGNPSTPSLHDGVGTSTLRAPSLT